MADEKTRDGLTVEQAVASLRGLADNTFQYGSVALSQAVDDAADHIERLDKLGHDTAERRKGRVDATETDAALVLAEWLLDVVSDGERAYAQAGRPADLQMDEDVLARLQTISDMLGELHRWQALAVALGGEDMRKPSERSTDWLVRNHEAIYDLLDAIEGGAWWV